MKTWGLFMFIWILLSVSYTSCRSSKIPQSKDFKVDKRVKNNELQVTLLNIGKVDFTFPTPRRFTIEKLIESGDWERIPINPCRCGVPCGSPPIPKIVTPSEEISFTWDYVSRKCRGRESVEYVIGEGIYRLGVVYQVTKGGIVQSSNTIFIEFKR